MGVLHHLTREGHIVVVGVGRAIDHHRGEAVVDARLAQLEGVAVVQVEHYGYVAALLPGHLHRPLGHEPEHGLVGVLARTVGELENDRGLGLDAGRDHRLKLFHVVEIVTGNGVAALHGLGKYLS